MTNSSEYTPSKVWTWNYPNSGRFATINRPINPFIPVHLARQTWFYLDLGAAAVFLAHLFFVRWSLTAPPRSGP